MLRWFDSTLLLDNFAKMYVTEHREQLYSHTSFSVKSLALFQTHLAAFRITNRRGIEICR